ncbi:EpsG family protein [Pedobacter sp. BG31]
MLIYYMIFSVAFTCTIFDYVQGKLLKSIIFLLFCSIVICFPAFRTVGVDNDSINYVEIFNSTINYSLSDILAGNYWENTERGYMLLNKVISMAGGDINWVFFIMAVATGLFTYSFIYKVSPLPFTSVLFYLSFFYLYRDFTQIRYALSASIAFYAIYFLANRRFILFLLSFIFAMLFHNASVVILLIAPFVFLVKNKYVYLIMPVFCTIGLFVNFFPLLLSLAGVPQYMSVYLEESGGAGLVVTVFGLAIMAIYTLFYKRLQDNDLDLSFYYRVFALGVSLNMLFFQSPIFQRFTYLLFQFGVILLPTMLAQLQKGKDKYYFVLLHFLFLCFLLYYSYKLIDPHLIRPYFEI